MNTLYDRIGGEGAIRVTITKMYEKILGDERISYFFDGVDVDRLRTMNSEFVSMAFGSKHRYNGKSLRQAHAKLIDAGLNDSHFDIMAEHLKAAMQEVGVDDDFMQEGLKYIESMRRDVLNQ